jgi:hypothetical protein
MFVPPSWQPITVSSKSCIPTSIAAAGLYGNSCDIYPSINIAGSWNWYRTLRISTIKIMMICLRELEQEYRCPNTAVLLNETVQVLIDEFCASIPFHLGDRTEPMLSHELCKVIYPCLPTQSTNETDGPRCATATSTAEHKRAAATSGAWFVLDPLSEVMKATVASGGLSSHWPVAQPENRPLLALRAGQREWLMGQMLRVQGMNLYGRVRSQASKIDSKISPVPLSTEHR